MSIESTPQLVYSGPMTLPLDALYRDIILDHYRSPRGIVPLENPDICSRGSNPSCGDELILSLKVVDDRVGSVSIQAKGCAISVASSSMLVEYIEGKTLAEAIEFGENIRKLMHGEEIDEGVDLGDLDSLQGVRKFPVRVKCALLAWVALLDAIKRYNSDTTNTTDSVTTE